MTPNQIRFGLMPVLDAALELQRTVLPLKSVRYHFVARGGMAEVEMTQVYFQENAQPLDCEYLFPLPADGALYRCEVSINGRVIRAQIEEREAARKIVAEKKAEGRRTALVESERDNLFTLSLGNLQPHDVVEVKLAYLQPLRRLAGQVALDLPLCPGVRYIPGKSLLRSNRGSGVVDDTDQVPDASRITPPRIDAEHPDAAFIELDGQVEARFLDGSISSPSHNLTVTRKGDLLHLTLARGGEVPDRDLALRWKERDADQPALRGWTSHEDGHAYALLELRAPASVVPTDAIAQDFYFLVDRSGSMQGEKWQKAIQALHGCVEVMGPQDRVAVTLFESEFNDFDAAPASSVAIMADPRFRELAAIGTAGGTELAPALRHVLEQVARFSKDRPAVLVLITDAEIGNEREITALMREHPSLPMHCFGIDTTLNDSLLLDLVRQQGGTFLALQPKEDVAAKVTELGRTLRQPVLVNLQAPAGWELAAGAIPNLYAGQIHIVSLRSRGDFAAIGLTVVARDQRNAPVSLEFKLAAVQEAGPRLRWCKERLVTLVARDAKSDAIILSKEANLLCPLTAFVAWDEQEKVAVAAHRLVQPAMAPEFAGGAGQLCEPAPMLCYAPPQASTVPRSFWRRADDGLKFSLASALHVTEAMPSDEQLTRLQERVRDFVSALGRVNQSHECLNMLREVADWVGVAANLDAIKLVSRLLDDCERKLEEWDRCEHRLQELTRNLAREWEQSASMLRDAMRQEQDQRSRMRQLDEALERGFSERRREEVRDTISVMVRLEEELREFFEAFLRRHVNPPAPAPVPQRKKGR